MSTNDATLVSDPVTRLLRVERDGNPLRRFGYVSPHIGKVAPLNAGALAKLSGLAAATLPPGPALLVGTTESSLLLAWFLAAHLGPDAKLVFTTRERRGGRVARRTFLEPHSHGPVHSLALPPDRAYHQRVVIVEDEITTGATLRNLLFAIRDVSDEHHVVTLSDLRPMESRESLQEEMSRLGVELSVTDLSRTREAGLADQAPEPYPAFRRNPFGRPEGVLEGAVSTLHRRWRALLRPAALYAVGECVDVALLFWESLPPDERPTFRHVTRSPWLADGRIVTDRLDLHTPRTPRHFLYNQTRPLPTRALLVGESSTAAIAARLSDFLASEGVETRTVEVPPS